MQEGVRQECKKEKEDRKLGCVSLIVSMGINELFPCVSARRRLPFVFTLYGSKSHTLWDGKYGTKSCCDESSVTQVLTTLIGSLIRKRSDKAMRGAWCRRDPDDMIEHESWRHDLGECVPAYPTWTKSRENNDISIILYKISTSITHRFFVPLVADCRVSIRFDTNHAKIVDITYLQQ